MPTALSLEQPVRPQAIPFRISLSVSIIWPTHLGPCFPRSLVEDKSDISAGAYKPRKKWVPASESLKHKV
jgi:hypothetical protein